MNDWCVVRATPPPPGACDWSRNGSAASTINRTTLGWNAAAASFAYAYARLAAIGFKYVGNDQLVGGVYPDNEPAVASLDWRTGEPNAKFYVVQMLAGAFGSGPKRLYNTSVGAVRSNATPNETKAGNCGPTTFGGDCQVDAMGAWNTTSAGIGSLAACVARCHAGCAKCNYVSFSKRWEDCSWYAHCDMRSLSSGYEHTTVAVTPERDATHPLHAIGVRLGSGEGVGGGAPLHDAGESAGGRRILLVSTVASRTVARLPGASGALATVLDGGGTEPGFQPPHARMIDADGHLEMGPYAVAVVQLEDHAGSK